MMNKIIAALVSLTLLATPALATGCFFCAPPADEANAQFQLVADGETMVATLSTIKGWDGAFRAGVAENVYNDEYVEMATSVNYYVPFFGASEMLESKDVYAEGDTSIIKQVQWASPGPANTANLYIGWTTASARDEVDVTNVGSGSALYNMNTNSPVRYLESFGLNRGTVCVPETPVPPVPPSCECEDCQCPE